MIKVGVTENVVLSKAEMTTKDANQWLTLTFRELGREVKEKKVLTAAEMMNEATDDTGNSTGETGISIFIPNMKKFGTEEVKSGEDLTKEIMDVKAQLVHILKRYMPVTSMRFNAFEKTSIPPQATVEDMQDKMQIATVYNQVYLNLCEQFIAQVKRFLDQDNLPSRLLLVRQSAAKSFGTFRKKFLGDQPFYESMDIPENLSKLLIHQTATGKKTKYHEPTAAGFLPKFTDYELEKGLDNPIRIEAEADESETTSEEASNTEALFSAGAEDTAAAVVFTVGDQAAA